jgi:hypothetical protein
MTASFKLSGTSVAVDNGTVLVPPGEEAVISLSGTDVTIRFSSGATSASANGSIITLSGFDNSLGTGVDLKGFILNSQVHWLSLVVNSVGNDSEPFRVVHYTFYKKA